MKAIFNRNGSVVQPRYARLLVKLGVAKYQDDSKEENNDEVIEDERKLSSSDIIEFDIPVVKKAIILNKEPKVRKKRTVKVKK